MATISSTERINYIKENRRRQLDGFDRTQRAIELGLPPNSTWPEISAAYAQCEKKTRYKKSHEV